MGSQQQEEQKLTERVGCCAYFFSNIFLNFMAFFFPFFFFGTTAMEVKCKRVPPDPDRSQGCPHQHQKVAGR